MWSLFLNDVRCKCTWMQWDECKSISNFVIIDKCVTFLYMTFIIKIMLYVSLYRLALCLTLQFTALQFLATRHHFVCSLDFELWVSKFYKLRCHCGTSLYLWNQTIYNHRFRTYNSEYKFCDLSFLHCIYVQLFWKKNSIVSAIIPAKCMMS